MSDIKFGRIASFDYRDHAFLLKAPRKAPAIRRQFWYTSPAWNQGETSQCVAYSGMKFLDSGPIRNTKLPFKQQWLYDECQKIDEWADEPHDGTSVRALFKKLKMLGYVSRYEWAFDADTIARWILTTGPMVVGTLWTEGMMKPDSKGFVKPKGRSMGGHAYLLKGVNLDTVCPDGSIGAFRLINSWGSEWGQNGCASISLKDFQVLMREDGEACTAVEVLKK